MEKNNESGIDKLNEDFPFLVMANRRFIGILRYNEKECKTTAISLRFDRKIGKVRIPRIIRDETSDDEISFSTDSRE